jgi:hypothetical protein
LETSYKKNRNGGGKQKQKQSPKNTQSSKQSKGKNRRKGRGKAQPISGFSTLSQVSGAPLAYTFHSSIPVPPPTTVMEPFDTCVLCGEKIDGIAGCFSFNNGYAHFDCVLNALREREHLEEGETISYLGSGSFGICRKDDEGKFTIVKKIEVENKEDYQNFKNYVESLKK